MDVIWLNGRAIVACDGCHRPMLDGLAVYAASEEKGILPSIRPACSERCAEDIERGLRAGQPTRLPWVQFLEGLTHADMGR